jgi:myo-inositol-1(or 4)-monophosphatase
LCHIPYAGHCRRGKRHLYQGSTGGIEKELSGGSYTMRLRGSATSSEELSALPLSSACLDWRFRKSVGSALHIPNSACNPKTPVLHTGSYTIRPLDSDDGEALQALCERATDYFELVMGRPPGPAEAQSLYMALPEGKTYDHKLLLGVFHDIKLIGVVDLIRDHPHPGTWTLGLLLLDPLHRGRGLGRAIVHALEDWVRQQGATKLRIDVARQNVRALHFWRHLGFQLVAATNATMNDSMFHLERSMSESDSRSLAEDIALATRAARAGATVLLHYFKSAELTSREKAALDVVTVADIESQEAIVSVLRTACPHDAVVAEESSSSVATIPCSHQKVPYRHQPGRVWYIDPLDGTFNFTRGLPYWCISIGLVRDGVAEAGVVFDPLRDEMFTGWRGGGAWVNGKAIQASKIIDPRHAAVQITIDYAPDTRARSLHDTSAIAPHVMRVRNLGALALSLAYVAAGRLDAVVQRVAHAWDYAAGILLVQESGAVASNLDGSPFDLFGEDALVAATPELHTRLKNLLLV